MGGATGLQATNLRQNYRNLPEKILMPKND
jgi:hypothetical protein